MNHLVVFNINCFSTPHSAHALGMVVMPTLGLDTLSFEKWHCRQEWRSAHKGIRNGVCES